MRRLWFLITLCVLGLALSAGTAVAAPATSTFTFTGTEQTYTVPAGVGSLHVVAIGAGGGSTLGGVGGSGASVSGDIAVTAGEVLYVEVGMGGGPGGNLGGAVGGGSSDVRTCSVGGSCPALGTALDPRLIVAGGGGGGGAAGGGGNGGDAFPGPASASPLCRPGADGGADLFGASSGGGGGSCEAPGAGGAPGSGGVAGLEGGPWVGGAGGVTGGGPVVFGGGGGGAGYFGGGGGGSGPTGSGNGAGGGAGSSFGPIGSVFAQAAGAAPEVQITPLVAGLSLGEQALSFAATQPQQTVGAPQILDITNSGNAALLLSSLTFAGQDPQDFLLSSDGCLGAIAPGASCQLGVSFAPQSAGARSAELLIASNDPSSPAHVALSGNGGTLPQGPAGAPGATGAPGPAGPRGAAGPAAKVTCTVKKLKSAKKVKVTCKVKATASTSIARLAHGGRTVAHRRLAPGTRRVVFLLPRQGRGAYTLTVSPRG